MNRASGVLKKSFWTDERGECQPATAIVRYHEAIRVCEHPLFVNLRENPVNMPALWALVANTHAGISPNFVRWLATTIARIDNREIACLMAKQLYDELGRGRFEQVHSRLLERFVGALEPWRPPVTHDWHLRAGVELARRTSLLFEGSEPYSAVGALIVAEVFAKEMDQCLGDEIRRQNHLSAADLEWLTIHEVLEVDHAEDSDELAVLVPRHGNELMAVWQGATDQWDALWTFLDDVHSIVVGLREEQVVGRG